MLTMARQVGKTWLLRDVCDWRLEQGDRFGVEQLVLSTGKDLAVVREMQRPARMWAKAQAGPVPGAGGERAGGDRVARRTGRGGCCGRRRACTGFGVDGDGRRGVEGAAAAVDEGLVPTMVEQPQSQLVARLDGAPAGDGVDDRPAGRRARALDDRARRALLIEWSAPRRPSWMTGGVAAGVAALVTDAGAADRRNACGGDGRRVGRSGRAGPDRVVPRAVAEPVAGETGRRREG